MTGRDLNFLCLPGDGIGPEIMCATKTVLDALSGVGGLHINWSDMEIGFSALKSNGSTIPNAVIEAARAADGVILGPVSHNAYPPVAEGGLNPSGVLRRELDLFANIRPAVSLDAVPSPILKSIDLVIYRENLEGFYADRNMASGGSEFMAIEGVALAMRKITASGSARIAREAFEGAMQRPAKHVTAVHKVNVMRLTDGLFLDEVRKLAAQYPEITYDEVLVDSAAALLVRDPGRFDVIVTTNMFGDILSDLASEISGGLGLAGSAAGAGAGAGVIARAWRRTACSAPSSSVEPPWARPERVRASTSTRGDGAPFSTVATQSASSSRGRPPRRPRISHLACTVFLGRVLFGLSLRMNLSQHRTGSALKKFR